MMITRASNGTAPTVVDPGTCHVHQIEHVTTYAAGDGIVISSRDLDALTEEAAWRLYHLLPHLIAEHRVIRTLGESPATTHPGGTR